MVKDRLAGPLPLSHHLGQGGRADLPLVPWVWRPGRDQCRSGGGPPFAPGGTTTFVAESLSRGRLSGLTPPYCWEHATVQAMAMGQQTLYPDHYNIRTRGSTTASIINMSIQLIPGQTWVWRQGR